MPVSTTIRKRRTRLLWGIVIASLVVFVIIGGIERYFPADVSADYFWLQMFTGTSWPTWDTFQKSSAFLFAIGATFQVMLGIGPLLGVLSLVWMHLTERRATMKLAHLIGTRDAALKMALKKTIRERCGDVDEAALATELDNVFSKTNAAWKKDMPVFLPVDRAERFLQELEEEK